MRGYVFLFKQKTAYEMRMSDWSSDVCSSDLVPRLQGARGCHRCTLLFRLPASAVGTRQQRKLQRVAPTVLSQTKEPCQSTARPLRRRRPQAQPQAQETV